MSLPPDTRAPGQAGHIGDHNAMVDAITSLQNQVQAILTSGLTTTGSVDISQAGAGLEIAEGANGRQGVAQLSGGSVTVPNTTVTVNTRIQLTYQSIGGTPGTLSYSVAAGASFTIHSTSGSDSSHVTFLLTEPG